jgi:hypothetical protein
MKTTMHHVDLRYEKEELLALFDDASQHDVDAGGRDARRSGALIIWSHPWTTEAARHDSEPLGPFSVHWADENGIYRIACDAGFDLADLLHALALLEAAALGYRKHGVTRF